MKNKVNINEQKNLQKAPIINKKSKLIVAKKFSSESKIEIHNKLHNRSLKKDKTHKTKDNKFNHEAINHAKITKVKSIS